MTAQITKPEVDMVFVNEVTEKEDGYWDLIDPFGMYPVGQDYFSR